MNTRNSIQFAVATLSLIICAASTVQAQQLQFVNPYPTNQGNKIGVQTRFEPVGNTRGTFAMFGERITYVSPSSPASYAGLEVGDVIVGYYSGNTYHRFFQSSEFPTALQYSVQNIRLKVINVRNGQFVDVGVFFDSRYFPGQGGYGNGQGGYGNGGYGQGGFNLGGNGNRGNNNRHCKQCNNNRH